MNDKPWPIGPERVLGIIVGAPLTIFTLLVLRAQVMEGFEPLGAIFGSASGSISVFCWLYFVKGPTMTKNLCFRYAMRGGMIIGSVGFLAGFIGPIIFMPTANQGPLLGIFITGPGGFVIGTLGGLVYGKWRSRALNTPNQAL